MSIKKITHKEVPVAALEKMSEEQRSYIDEFMFYKVMDQYIIAEYARELLVIWSGVEWMSKKDFIDLGMEGMWQQLEDIWTKWMDKREEFISSLYDEDYH